MMVPRSLLLSHARSSVTLSTRALDKFAALRTTERASPAQAIGLIQTASGLSLVLDQPGRTDRVISRDGVPIFFVAADLGRRLRGRVLDFGGPTGQERFTIERVPSASPLGPDSSRDQQSQVFTTLLREALPKRSDHDSQATTGRHTVDVIEVLANESPDGFGFNFRVRTSGRLYRIEPARDPHQPRYWCFRIFRCLPSLMVDVTERPWHGEGGMTWGEVPAAAEAIRADPNGWLETQQFQQLRRWILEEDQPPEDSPHSSL